LIVGIGLDLVAIERIARLVDQHGSRFVSKVYTAREEEACHRQNHSAEPWAARFAAKEAVMKALGTGWRQGVKFREIEVLPDPAGKPEIILHGRTAEVAAARGCTRAFVSLTHEAGLAAAVVVLEGDGPGAEPHWPLNLPA